MVWLLEHEKQYGEALVYCNKALEFDPGYVYAISYKGKLLYLLGRYEDALACYDGALKLDPLPDRDLLSDKNSRKIGGEQKSVIL